MAWPAVQVGAGFNRHIGLGGHARDCVAAADAVAQANLSLAAVAVTRIGASPSRPAALAPLSGGGVIDRGARGIRERVTPQRDTLIGVTDTPP